MKKIIFAFLTAILLNLPVLAAEKMSVNVFPRQSYLIMLEKSADVVMPNDKDILNAKILTTIYEKNQIIVKVLKEGTAKLYIAMGDDIAIVEFNSNLENKNNSNYKCSKSIEAFLRLDKPYVPAIKVRKKNAEFQLDAPPPLGGFKN